MSNPKHWWYGYVKKAIQESPRYRERQEPEYISYCEAIDKSFEELEQAPDGTEKVKTVKSVLFNQGSKGHYGDRSVERIVSDFVYSVARNKGFINK